MLKNRRIKRGLLLSACLTMFLTAGFASQAKELSGEQTISQEEFQNGQMAQTDEITMVDEEGNIVVIGDTDGFVESSDISVYSRTTPVMVVNFNTKDNDTTSYTEYSTGASGYTNGDYGADAAYLGTENGKVKFMLSGVVGLVKESEVQLVKLTDVKAVSYYIVQNGRLWHRIVHNMNQSGFISALDQGPAPSYLTAGQEYYSYDGHFFYKDYAVMLDDYVNEVRTNSVNAKNPHYNYYQYLPLRSTTTYTEKELNSLINAKAPSSKMTDLAPTFIAHQNTYGTNALLLTGIAANESAWGTSSICKAKNNLFGINAVDTSPATSATTFETPAECVRQFAETYMSKRYLRPGYSYYHGGFLGNKASGINVSYASDPYWGEKAANMAWTLDRNGGSKDYGKYTIAIKDTLATKHTNINVRNAADTSATSLYKTGAWSNYAMLVLNTTKENGFYKVQSDGVLNSARSAIDTASGTYKFSTMYAYVHADYVTIVNNGDVELVAPKLASAKYNNGSVTITWGSVDGAQGYKIYRKEAGGKWTKIGEDRTGTATSYKDESNLTAETTYYYTVRAFANGENGPYDDNGLSVKFSLTTPSLVSAKYNNKKVTVNWEKVYGAEGYKIYRKVSGGKWSKIGEDRTGTAVSYVDETSLEVGKTYYYTVRAFANGVNSSYNGTGLEVKIPATLTYTKGLVSSKVYYRTGPGTSYAKPGMLAQGATIQIEDGYSKKANGFTWYRFKMNNKNYYVAAEYVKKISSDIAKPKLISAKYSSGAISFKWNKVSGATGYYVYRKENGGSWKRVKNITSGTTVTYKDSSVSSGKTYTYTVRAYTADKVSQCDTKGVSASTGKSYTTYVTTSKVNYRVAPGLDEAKGGTLEKGTKISVENGYSKTADGYTWYRFKLNGKEYYVVSKYLKKQ